MGGEKPPHEGADSIIKSDLTLARTTTEVSMYLDEKAIQAIEDALRRGSDVQIQRQGQGCKVLEIKRTIKYTSA